MKTAVFLITGFEEIEAVTPVDILRRGGVEVTTVSLTGELVVSGSHGIEIVADALFDPAVDFDILILPGGPGTKYYHKYKEFLKKLELHHAQGKMLAAICAAPTVLGSLGLLKNKKATCFPSMESELNAGELTRAPVVTDGNITTSRSAATALAFALELLTRAADANTTQEIARQIVLENYRD
jgi:4-methyl-5(b-hydroxyethyl)-thiazole monophosphate biosynthesis